MKKINLFLIALLFSIEAQALSLRFSAGECVDPVNSNITTPSSRMIESVYHLFSDEGGGIYQLVLNGGIPRFTNNSSDVCIDTETSMGYSGLPEGNNYLPSKNDRIPATAYFDGKTLIIFSNAIYSDLSGKADYIRKFVQTSIIIPSFHALFFNYIPQSNSFSLTRMIKNYGFVMSNAVSVPKDTYLEGIKQNNRPVPEIFIPPKEIIYTLQ